MPKKQEGAPLDTYIIDHIRRREEENRKDRRPSIYDTPTENPLKEPEDEGEPTKPKFVDERVYGNKDDDEATPGVEETSIDDLLAPREDDPKDEGGD